MRKAHTHFNFMVTNGFIMLPVNSKTGILRGLAAYPLLTQCCSSSIVETLVVSSGRLSSTSVSASNRDFTSFFPADFIL